MLIGEYSSRVGEKKRVAIPKKYREELGNNLIITRGYEECLILVNKEKLEKIAEEIINGSFIDKNIRETSRFLVGSAVEAVPDTQGRVVIPSHLFDYAKFDQELVFIGLINWVEIWEKSLWEEKLKYLSDKGDEIAQALRQNTHTSNA